MAVAIAHMAFAIVLLPALSFAIAAFAERVQINLIIITLLLPLCVFGQYWLNRIWITRAHGKDAHWVIFKPDSE